MSIFLRIYTGKTANICFYAPTNELLLSAKCKFSAIFPRHYVPCTLFKDLLFPLS